MVVRVSVEPALMRWAMRRSGHSASSLHSALPRIDEWLAGDAEPTVKQLETFAQRTHTPLGFLLLDVPPKDNIPMPDFRTVGDRQVDEPSVDLLDTIYACQQRQEWFRSFAITDDLPPVEFVGAGRPQVPVVQAAARIRDALGYSFADQLALASWTEGRRFIAEAAERIGILVMISGIVGSDTHRPLNPAEFRGFALADDLAPLIFVNGADAVAAQTFTIAHELAHLWINVSGISSAELSASETATDPIEQWCNQVAAELLVPEGRLRNAFDRERPIDDELQRLASLFRVSQLVILRRLHDADLIDTPQFRTKFDLLLSNATGRQAASRGDFYNTLFVRVGRRFARAMVVDTLEGRTTYREAAHLLGFSSMATFDQVARRLDVA